MSAGVGTTDRMRRLHTLARGGLAFLPVTIAIVLAAVEPGRATAGIHGEAHAQLTAHAPGGPSAEGAST